MSQTLFTNATLACFDGDSGYGLRDNAALLVEVDKIAWLGTDEQVCVCDRHDAIVP